MSAKGTVREVTITVCGMTDVGVVRKNNEDAFLIAPLGGDPLADHTDCETETVGERGMLLIVSDGMGGAEAGEVASRMVVETLSANLASAPIGVEPKQAIREAVERSNAAVWNESVRTPSRKGMGATLAAALVKGGEAYIASVGDSRVYLMRSARIRQITRDQSMVESMVEAGMMTREEAQTHPQRNMILQAMGAKPEVVVALERVALRRGDVLVLCSDGLSGKMQADEIRDCILATPTLSDACDRLIALANHRGGEDNITVVLGELGGDGLPAAPLGERLTRTLEPVAKFDYMTGNGYAPLEPAKPTIPLGSEAPESKNGKS